MARFYRNVVLKIIGENWKAKHILYMQVNQLLRLSNVIKVDSKV